MRILLGMVLVAGLFVAVPNISNTRAYAEGSTINIEITAGAGAKTDDAYAPNPAQANVGDTVIWTNNDTTPHTATSGLPEDPDGKFGGNAATGGVVLFKGDTQSHTFTAAGEYPYACFLHPNMVGAVVVGGDAGLTVKTDRPNYDIGDDVTISGKVGELQQDRTVLLRIEAQDGTVVRLDVVMADANGRFAYEFQISGPLFEQDKSYLVIAIYNGQTENTSFRIGDPSSQRCQGMVPTIVGTEGDDDLEGTKRSDVIVGLEGDDIIHGFGGDDFICGGQGDDRLSGGWDNDRILGGRGNDFLFGNAGDDRMWGGTGFDRLFGNDGDDVMFGGKGRDNLKSGEGHDQLDGQEGDDIVDGVREGENPDSDFSIMISEKTPQAGDEIMISGEVYNAEVIEEAVISIHAPRNGGTERFDVLFEDEHGEFDLSYEIPIDADDGVYSVKLEYDGNYLFSYFLIDEEDDPVAVMTDNDVYELGDDVEIAGEVEDLIVGYDDVRIIVLDPVGEDWGPGSVSLDDIEFQETIEIEGDYEGVYALIVEYAGEESGWFLFDVEGDGNVDDGEIIAHLSRPSYTPGVDVTIFGSIDADDVEVGEEVFASIIGPDAKEVFADSTEPDSDGGFTFTFDLDDDADIGLYKVILSYAVYDDKEIAFVVSSGTSSRLGIVIEVDDEYGLGDEVEVAGFVEDVETGIDEVTITITEPVGTDESEEVELDDGEFLFEYLLDDFAEDGIYTVEVEYDSISVFSYFLVDEEDDEIELEIDSDSYLPGDEVEVVGFVHDPQTGEDEVEIAVLDPLGDQIVEESIALDDDEFDFEFGLDDDAPSGRYALIGTYDNQEQGWLTFELEDGSVGSNKIVASMSKSSFRPNEEITVTGIIDEIEIGEELLFDVISPSGNLIRSDELAIDNSGLFSFTFDLDDATVGRYGIHLSYVGYEETELVFFVLNEGDAMVAIVLAADYDPGDTIEIMGVVGDLDDSLEALDVTVTSPDGTDVADRIPLDDHEFSYGHFLENNALDGIYTVRVHYNGSSAVGYFVVDQESDTVEIASDSDAYRPGANVEIFGFVEDLITGEEEIQIMVLDPNGGTIFDEVVGLEYNEFEVDFTLGGDAPFGRYAVVVLYDGEKAGFHLFEVAIDGSEGNPDYVNAEIYRYTHWPGDSVFIDGFIDSWKLVEGHRVNVTIINPDYVVISTDGAKPADDGSFDFTYVLPDNISVGYYQVVLGYPGYEETVLYFLVVEPVPIGGEGISVIDAGAYGIEDVKMASVNDRLYFTWAKDNGYGSSSVFVRSSDDAGQSLGPEVQVDRYDEEAPSAFRPDVAVSSNGTVYVAWIASRDSYGESIEVHFSASHDGGQTFLPAQVMRTPDEFGEPYAFEFRLAADGDDVYLLWQNREALLFAASHDEGRTFEDTQIISRESNQDSAKIVAKTGRVYIVYSSFDYDREDQSKILLQISHDGGETFREPVELSIGEMSAGENHDIFPSMAVNDAGIVLVVWQRTVYYGGFTQFVASRIDGEQADPVVQEPIVIDGNESCEIRSWGPQIGFSDDDNVHIVYNEFCWIDDVTNGMFGKITIVTSSDGGETFSAPRSVWDGQQGVYGEQVVADDNKIHISWIAEHYSEYGCCDPEQFGIMLASSADYGQTFSDQTLYSNKDSFGFSVPEIAHSDDNVHVSWTANWYSTSAAVLRSIEYEDQGTVDSSISAELLKTEFDYIQGDTVQVLIDVDNGVGGEVSVTLREPDGDTVLEDYIDYSNDGFTQYDFVIGNEAKTGQYELGVAYMGDEQVLSFDVRAKFAELVNLSNNSGPSFDPIIETAGDNVYVTWLDGTTPERNWAQFFAYSKNRGGNFTAPAVLSLLNQTAYFADMSAHGSDVYLVWLKAGFYPNEDTDFSGVAFRASHDGGATFGEQMLLVQTESDDSNSTEYDSLDLAKVFAFEDNVYVVWSDTYHVYVRVSNDRGATFGPAIVLESSDRRQGQVGGVQMAGYGQNVHVAWSVYAGSDNGLYVRSSIDGGSSFEDTIAIADGAEYMQMFAAGDNVYLAWQNSPGSNAYEVGFSASNDNGLTFSDPITLGGIRPSSAAGPIIATSEEGDDVYVLWDAHFQLALAASHDAGRTFEPGIVIGSGGEFDFPVVAASGDNVYVAWKDDTENGSHNILYSASSDGGATFTDELAILENRDFIARSIAASGADVYLALAGNEVYFMKLV
jgi:plastocyanin